MKLSVGYQLGTDAGDGFAGIVEAYRDHVAEVYFAPPGMPSGRSPLPDAPEASRRFEADLQAIRGLGVRLNLLINASCYGGLAMSRTLERCVAGELDRLGALVGGVESVTTTSPAVAEIVRRHAPAVAVRASVNMRIGTIQGMEYLADRFDGYYVQRDDNRDLAHLARLKAWADAHGKTLGLLANSGCLRFCSGQTFHDNLVSHEPDVAAEDNLDGFLPYTCWGFLRRRENWPAVLRATWIRPEDLHHYDGLFDAVKLATRMHQRPWAVIAAYARGRYEGNLLDLLEPGFGRALAPYVIDNSRFPPDWFERTSTCGGRCDECDYCRAVLARTCVRLEVPAAPRADTAPRAPIVRSTAKR